MSITIDGALFWARLQKVHGAWQGSLKNRSFGGADALFVVTGKIDDDAPPFQRSQSLHLFLIQYEFPELAMLFTETGLTILSSDKKLKHLEPLLAAKPEGCALSLALLARNKADKNAENYATLLKLTKGSGKGEKLGVLGKEAPLGAFAEQTKEAVDAAGLERADVTKGFGLALAPKDSVELGHLRTAAKLTSRLLRKVFVDEMETIIDEEKKVKHSTIAGKLNAHLETPEKLKLLHSKKDVIDADDVEACFEPAVQSGGSYVTKLSAQSSDAPMTSDVVIASMGVRYKSYCGMIARTFMVDPVKKVERAYLLLQSLHEYLCESQLKAGAVVADVVVAAQKFVKERDPSLLPHLSKSIGWGVGLEIRDSALTLDTKNEAKLQAGMCVTVCVSFSKVALSAKERKLADGAAGSYPLESFSLMLADVVAVGEAGAPSELLTKSETRFDSVQYTLGGDSDEDEDEDDEDEAAGEGSGKGKGKAAAVKTEDGGPGSKLKTESIYDDDKPLEQSERSKLKAERLRRQAAIAAGEQTEEEKRQEHQRELIKQQAAEAAAMRKGGGPKDAGMTDEAAADPKHLVSYKKMSTMPIKASGSQILCDSEKKTVLLPINGVAVPFHISTIKSVTKAQEGKVTTCRFNFYSAGAALDKDSNPAMGAIVEKHKAQAWFLRELSFRTQVRRTD